MKIHIHLGAHKTATTFIQSQLHDHSAALGRAGIATLPIARLRRDFTRHFDLLARLDTWLSPLVRPVLRRRLEALLATIAPGATTLVLSDENLAGLIRDNYRSGGLYRQLGARALLLKDLLAGHDVRFFFAIRPYPEYLASSYLQMASRGRVPAFSRYLGKLPPSMPGWSEAIADLATAVGPENLTVWTYDWFKEDPQRLFDLIAPGAKICGTDEELRRDVLPSLSVKGFRVMQALEGQLTRGEYQRLAKLMRSFAFDEPNERVEVADAAALDAYGKKFRADLVSIGKTGTVIAAGRSVPAQDRSAPWMKAHPDRT